MLSKGTYNNNMAERTQCSRGEHIWLFSISVPPTFSDMWSDPAAIYNTCSKLALITRQEREKKSCQVEFECYFCSQSTKENLGMWFLVAARESGNHGLAMGAYRRDEKILVGT